MPREVKAYLCVHKCGRKASTNRKSVEKHEETCKCNIERQACKTCKHDYYDDYGGCQVEHRPDGAKMLYNCKKWEISDFYAARFESGE